MGGAVGYLCFKPRNSHVIYIFVSQIFIYNASRILAMLHSPGFPTDLAWIEVSVISALGGMEYLGWIFKFKLSPGHRLIPAGVATGQKSQI